MSSLHDQLDADFAPAWRPEAGDKLVGVIVGIGERAGEYDPYPIITVRQDDGTEVAFHAFHTVAASELAKVQPKIGERIGVLYRGKVDGKAGGPSYHAYRVKVDRPVEGSFSWAKYASGGDDDPAAGSPDDAEGRQPRDEDDIPF